MKELKRKPNLKERLYEIYLITMGVLSVVVLLLCLAMAFLGLSTKEVHANEPLNVTNVHYTADNGLQTDNTFTLREGYRERIYYQIEYTGDGNPADLMLMWNDYQGIEITVQQYTQGSGVMLVRYNESFSGWGVTSFWVQGGNGNGKRLLRFRAQPNAPIIEQPDAATEVPTEPVETPAPVVPQQPQTQTEEQSNENTTGIENGLSEQQHTEQQPSAGTNEKTIISGHDGAQQQTGITTRTNGERGQTTTSVVEEKTPEKTLDSTEKQQEAPTASTEPKTDNKVDKRNNGLGEHLDAKKETKGKVLTIVIVSGIILGSLVIQITERVGKRK